MRKCSSLANLLPVGLKCLILQGSPQRLKKGLAECLPSPPVKGVNTAPPAFLTI